MSKEEERSGDAQRMDRQAAEWLAKRQRGFSAREQDAFFAWLAEDPRHGEWFAQHSRTWRRLDTLAQWRPEHSEQPNQDLLRTGPFRRRWTSWFLGMAALLVVGLIVFAAWERESTKRPGEPRPQSLVAKDFERHELEDGSRIDMNRGAALEVEYTEKERRVELVSSEAHFVVAKDPDRPFIVSARGVEVRAVGTAFNIRISEDRVEVLVTEGRVRMGSPVLTAVPVPPGAPERDPLTSDPLADLVAGQMAVVPASGGEAKPVVSKATVEAVQRVIAWRRSLDFDAVPLGDVVAEFNRRNRVQIEIEDPHLHMVPIVASFRSDNASHFVELLELTMNIEAVRQKDRIVLKQGERRSGRY